MTATAMTAAMPATTPRFGVLAGGAGAIAVASSAANNAIGSVIPLSEGRPRAMNR
jgi:hypothetical protein